MCVLMFLSALPRYLWCASPRCHVACFMILTAGKEMIPADILVLRVPDGCGHGDADGVHKGLQATVVPAHLQLVAVEVGTAHLQLVAVEVGTQVPGLTMAEPEGGQVTGPTAPVLQVPVGVGHGDHDVVHNGLQVTVVPAHLQLGCREGAQVLGPIIAPPISSQAAEKVL